MTTHESKFQALEAEAIASLRRPHEIGAVASADRPSLALLIWEFPAFEPYRSWALLQRGDAAAPTYLVRRTTWDRPTDYRRAYDPLRQASFLMDPRPAPTVEAVDVRLAADAAERIAGSAARLAIPAFEADRAVTLDGRTSGVSTRRRTAGIEWNGDGPPAWLAFTTEVGALRAALEAAASAGDAVRRSLVTP